MKMRLFILTVIFSYAWTVQAQSNFDVIYPMHGDPIKCQLSEVFGAAIKYKAIENLNGPVYSKPKQDVLLIFKSNGDFMIPTSSENDKWIKGADPEAHKIITRNNEIYPAKYVELRGDTLIYEDVKKDMNYKIPKEDVLLVIYKDGGHEMLTDALAVVEGLTKVKSHINNYSASKLARVPETRDAIVLNEVQKKYFEGKAKQKCTLLGKYLTLISDKSENEDDRLYAKDEAVGLFIDDSAKVEVSSLNRKEKVQYPIRKYLDRLYMLPYDKVELLFADVAFVGKFLKGEDGKYYGTVTAVQTFRALTGDFIGYQDVTEKNIQVVLDRYDVFDEGKKKTDWDVRLADITVQQTREK